MLVEWEEFKKAEQELSDLKKMFWAVANKLVNGTYKEVKGGATGTISPEWQQFEDGKTLGNMGTIIQGKMIRFSSMVIRRRTYYFTFGHGQDPGIGYYTTRVARHEGEARELMAKDYGLKWSFCYTSAEEAGVYKYNLKHVH